MDRRPRTMSHRPTEQPYPVSGAVYTGAVVHVDHSHRVPSFINPTTDAFGDKLGELGFDESTDARLLSIAKLKAKKAAIAARISKKKAKIALNRESIKSTKHKIKTDSKGETEKRKMQLKDWESENEHLSKEIAELQETYNEM